MKHQGKIVFYKGVFGFIACHEFDYNLFFLESDLLPSYRKKAKRGDIVTFITVPNLKKKNQKKAAGPKQKLLSGNIWIPWSISIK
jgi:hypothetical protein